MARSRRVALSVVFGAIATLVIATPTWAQLELEGDYSVFTPLTGSQQAEVFERGVTAYDGANYSRAFEIWLPLAQRGNMAAQRNVGHLLRRGLGVDQDLPRAVYFYRRASETGLVSAMVNLSAMLRAGQGVDEPDFPEAARWLYLASRAGDPRAQYVLGVMAARGQGMDQNRELAIELFRRAAEQGLREARERLTEAGLEPSNIGDEVERPEFSLPPELEPLPDVGLGAELANVTIPAATPQPEQALSQPVPTLRRAQPLTAPVVTPQPEPEPVAQPARVADPVVEEPQSLAQEPSRLPTRQPTVQRVSQPAAPPPSETARPVPITLPPPPQARQPEPEPEPEIEENSALQRLLGGTQ